jgi:hypothetical protein
MSGALTAEEINQLLTGIDVGDSKGLKHTAPLTQGEVDRLLAAIEAVNHTQI